MAGHSYLLDTNILSDLIKHPSGTVARHSAAVGEKAVCTSIVVACELRYGAAKKGSPALSGKIGQLLETIEVLPLEDDSDQKYGEIRTALRFLPTYTPIIADALELTLRTGLRSSPVISSLANCCDRVLAPRSMR